MDPSNLQKQQTREEPRYLDFPHDTDHDSSPSEPTLNRYSSTLTKGHRFPGAQVRVRPVIALTTKMEIGNVVRCRRTGSEGDEDKPSRRYCIGLVGRKPVQHAFVGIG